MNKIPTLGSPGTRRLLFVRGFTGLFAIVFFRFGLLFIAPSDCSAIQQSSVVVTAILARIFLKEKLGIPHLFSVVLIIQGVIFISKPSFLFHPSPLAPTLSHFVNGTENSTVLNHALPVELPSISHMNLKLSDSVQTIIGIQFVLLSALFSGILAITIKKLCIRNVHWSVSTIYCSYVGLPFCLATSALIYFYGVTHGNVHYDMSTLGQHILLSCFSSIFAIAGQIFLNMSYNYEDASKVAIAKTSEVFFSYFLQMIILHIQVDLLSITGSILIVCGTVIVLVFKMVENSIDQTGKSWFKTFLGIRF